MSKEWLTTQPPVLVWVQAPIRSVSATLTTASNNVHAVGVGRKLPKGVAGYPARRVLQCRPQEVSASGLRGDARMRGHPGPLTIVAPGEGSPTSQIGPFCYTSADSRPSGRELA
jgi:hypothetical protein